MEPLQPWNWSAFSLSGVFWRPTGPGVGVSTHIGPSPLAPSQVPGEAEERRCVGLERPTGARGRGRRAPPLRYCPPHACGPVSANLSPRSTSRANGGRRGRGGGPGSRWGCVRLTSTRARVLAAAPAEAAEWAAPAAGISGAHRACSPLAVAWGLRAQGGCVSHLCAVPWAVPEARTPIWLFPLPAPAHLCGAARPACLALW